MHSLELRQRTDIPMYDSLVAEPRLTAWWHAADGGPEPTAVLADLRRLLTERSLAHPEGRRLLAELEALADV